MATYSFMDVTASFTGPNGVIDLGFGSAVTKEGITVAYGQTRNTMTIGGDGEGMHSLKADKSGTVVVRLLYTSPVNAKLQAAYNAQSLSSSLWGNNVITIRNKGNGETVVCRSCAFQKSADITYSEDGQMREWTFDCVKIDVVTGEY